MSGAVAATPPATLLVPAQAKRAERATRAEIAGGLPVSAVVPRLARSPLRLVPGLLPPAPLAGLPGPAPAALAGRVHAARDAHAAGDGISILAPFVWPRAAEGVRPDRCDLLGAAVCRFGAGIIPVGPRAGA